jgi:hypothetical protein
MTEDIMRPPTIAAATALSLAGCAMNAANHDPTWTVILAGNYKDVASCAFDRLRRGDCRAL